MALLESRGMMPNPRADRRLLIGLAFLAGYIALDFLSFIESYRGYGITPWNPPPGLTLALIALGGRYYAAFALLAPLLAELLIRPGQLPLWLAALGTLAVGGVYLATGLQLRRLKSFDARLLSVRDIVMLGGAAVVAAACAALLYVGLIAAIGGVPAGAFARVAWRYFVGDLIGILMLTPLILLASRWRGVPRPRAEFAAQLAAIIAGLLVVFGLPDEPTYQLFYVLFLPMLWIALRHGIVGAALAILATQIGLLVGVMFRFGSFAELTALQALMITLAITGLLVGSAVTERQIAALRLREQRLALQRALQLNASGEAAAAIAHELSQPLTAVSAYASTAEAAIEAGNAPLARESIDKLRTQAERAGSALSSIRRLFQPATQRSEPLDIRALLDDVHRLLGDELAAGNIRLSSTAPDQLPVIFGDQMQIRQALQNLVTNSIEAMKAYSSCGTIDICVNKLDESNIIMEIRDTGPGFPPGLDLQSLAPFITTRPDGSGLGLVIARHVAEAHGGRLVLLTSRNGAVAQLILPALGETDAGNCIDH